MIGNHFHVQVRILIILPDKGVNLVVERDGLPGILQIQCGDQVMDGLTSDLWRKETAAPYWSSFNDCSQIFLVIFRFSQLMSNVLMVASPQDINF